MGVSCCIAYRICDGLAGFLAHCSVFPAVWFVHVGVIVDNFVLCPSTELGMGQSNAVGCDICVVDCAVAELSDSIVRCRDNAAVVVVG